MTCKHGFPAPNEMTWAGSKPPRCAECEIESLATELEECREQLAGEEKNAEHFCMKFAECTKQLAARDVEVKRLLDSVIPKIESMLRHEFVIGSVVNFETINEAIRKLKDEHGQALNGDK